MLRLWACLQLYTLLNNKEDLVFYKWFREYGPPNERARRGISTYAYKYLGLVNVPKLTLDKLITVKFLYILCMSVVSMGMPLSGISTLGLILSILYHGSMWAEQKSSFHRSVASIAMWTCGVLAENDNEVMAAMRVWLSTVYFASVLQKVLFSIHAGKLWPHHSPRHFIWKSSWTRPSQFKDFLLLNPILLKTGGWLSLVAETLPMMHCFGLVTNWMAYLPVLLMHIAIYYGQSIDYMHFWAPVLLVGMGPECEMNFKLMIFLGFQIVYAFTFMENFNINLPPLMSSPMFVTVCDVFDDQPQYYLMAIPDYKGIWYERLEWMFPFLTESTGIGYTGNEYNYMVFFGFSACRNGMDFKYCNKNAYKNVFRTNLWTGQHKLAQLCFKADKDLRKAKSMAFAIKKRDECLKMFNKIAIPQNESYKRFNQNST